MEQEHFFSGYCRALDSGRTVEVIITDGIPAEVDCAYPDCIHRSSCPIAKQIDDVNHS